MEKTLSEKEDPWIEYLISGYVQENLEASERRELNEWIDASKDNRYLFEDMTAEKIMDALLQWETSLAASKDTRMKQLCN
jgi:alpha-amylase/alpha-mannosidase (GH57 family)